jgi:hypothetical protein
MDPQTLIPLLTALVSAVFAVFVFDQFLSRRRPYQLVWALALLAFGAATGARFVGATFGWSEPAFKVWYGGGAYCAAALLGMGTAYLLLPRRVAHTVFALLGLGLAAAIAYLAVAPVDMARSVEGLDVSGAGLPALARTLSAPFNIFGVIFFIGGALWSGGRMALRAHERHDHRLRSRALANLTIAAGGLVFAASGSLSKYFGMPSVLYLAEFAGTVIIFAGFLLSIEVFDHIRIPFTRVVLKPDRHKRGAHAA